MFERTLLESAFDRQPVLTSRHRVAAVLAGFTGFLATWKLLPLFSFAVSVKAALTYSLLLGTGLALHALMACYVFGEARRLGLGSFRWLATTLATSVAGFIVFLIHSARRTGDWKRATVPLATLFEVLLVGVLVLVPFIHTQALDLKGLRDETLYVPAPPPPRIVAVVHERAGKQAPSLAQNGTIIAPRFIPERIADVVEEQAGPVGPDIGVIGGFGIPGGSSDGVIGGILNMVAGTAPPAPAAAQPKPKPVQRIKVGGQVEAARLIYQPKPIYPRLALVTRVQGIVRLEAIIGNDGRVQNLKVLSGHPLLVNAALDAVAQWRYQPTLLNGEPVEVQTEIDVNFVLGD
jgi:protein TonB